MGSGFWTTYDVAGGDSVKDALFIDNLLAQANAGKMSQQDFKTAIVNQLGITVGDWDNIVSKEEQPNERLFELIKKLLKPKFKIGLLSNANKGVIQRKIPKDKLSLFDDLTVSGEVGILKPSPEIFTITAQNLGVNLDEILFVDDLEEYIQGAETIGIKTIHYKGYNNFLEELGKFIDLGLAQAAKG